MQRRMNTMGRAILGMAVIWTLAMTRPAFAAEPTFDQADVDGDGYLTRQEAVDAYDWSAGLFAVIDADGDKRISRQEFANWAARKKTVANDGKAAAVFQEMDRLGNHDGLVSLGEWWGDPAVFAAKDTNHDGVLTLQEFLAPLETGRPPDNRPIQRERDD